MRRVRRVRMEPMKYIAVSKLRLMAGRSTNCVVCSAALPEPTQALYPTNHLCAEHVREYRLRVVDSGSSLDADRALGEVWEDDLATPEVLAKPAE